ncbi:putative dehydrogenase [Enterococcus sp. PF1-24]|uniref:Gfo/Idh/MocA family protein n=1 Tax=unclassified Enterococcus TaxID=2608891 RepID=UPI002473086A|nr:MULTISPECIES: Gfo/Idh/MocA family oxidoreductase [unclassified Enterococcus]MDH6363991.1 putative dehydrogenase [Enterococcus sp. PFB1-1]MDH6401092.1 putative dehydrogenase [Enterococcus sp. PF1-24]
MKKVNVVIIGIGNIGNLHINNILSGEIQGVELAGFCDINPEKLVTAKERYGENYKFYGNAEEVFKDSEVDAVIISTPHYDHPVLAIAALKAGKHALVEKPAGVYTKKVREMIEESQKHPELTLSLMYNQRMNPIYQKAKELVEAGEIGELRRTNWIITNWYRSQSYYNSGGWRATWAGEGGGVLLNQDPHQLDLWQWICGMPERVYSFAYYGKRREVEVETEVTAYVEYANGATGVFVTTTTETPGTNRFEIVGSQGKIVIEDEQLKFWRTVVDEAEWNETYTGGFGEPEVWEIKIPVTFDGESGHRKVTQNFVNNILNGEKLVSPAEDGIFGLSISNAIHLSSWLERWVDLPIDEDLFLAELNKRIATSQVKDTKEQILDTEGSY